MANNTQTLLNTIRNRRSIRKFSDKPVDEQLIKLMVEAAGNAPSNSNRQPWKFIAVSSASVKKLLTGSMRQEWDKRLTHLENEEIRSETANYVGAFEFMGKAPVIIVALCKRPSLMVEAMSSATPALTERLSGDCSSTAMAVQNMLLMSHALGLGACPMTGPLIAEERIKEILKVSKHYNICCLVAVGWPDETPPAPQRKTTDKILEFIGE